MKIAQIAPLAESVPPKLYGGTERIVSYLTEELVRQGHDVTLFASGDSVTSARLNACTPKALRLNPQVRDTIPHHLLMLERIRQIADSFDVLHFHIDLFQFPLLRSIATPGITTLHGRLDLPDLQPFYRTFPDIPLVSISDHQRLPMPPVRWVGTIHHGLPPDLYRFSPTPDAGPVPRLPRPHFPREAPRPRHRDRHPRRHAPEDRRQGRQRRRRLLAHRDRAAGPRQPAGRVRRRDRRARQGRLPRRRHRAGLPDRLARALRPRDDRGDGLRHPGHRLPLRLGPRGRSTTASPASSSRTSTKRSPPFPSPPRWTAPPCAPPSRSVSRSKGWPPTTSGSTSRSAGAANRSARARPCRSPPDPRHA